MTFRSNDQFKTTLYGYSDRLRRIEGERTVLMMAPQDIAGAGLMCGQRVTLVTGPDDGVIRRVTGLKVIPHDLPTGAVAGYFPELNTLSPISRRDKLSDIPASKAIPVRIET